MKKINQLSKRLFCMNYNEFCGRQITCKIKQKRFLNYKFWNFERCLKCGKKINKNHCNSKSFEAGNPKSVEI
jgi:hypothetical protein